MLLKAGQADGQKSDGPSPALDLLSVAIFLSMISSRKLNLQLGGTRSQNVSSDRSVVWGGHSPNPVASTELDSFTVARGLCDNPAGLAIFNKQLPDDLAIVEDGEGGIRVDRCCRRALAEETVMLPCRSSLPLTGDLLSP